MCYLSKRELGLFRQIICDTTGPAPHQVVIYSTHTGPVVNPDRRNGMVISGDAGGTDLVREYAYYLIKKFAVAAVLVFSGTAELLVKEDAVPLNGLRQVHKIYFIRR